MRRMKIYTALILVTSAAMIIIVKSDLFPLQSSSKTSKSSHGSLRFDAPPPATTLPPPNVGTGTSTIPTFPRLITLPSGDVGSPSGALPAGTSSSRTEQYQLVGLGIRTVSFLSIQVYVVGVYIAIPDIEILQERLIRTIDPVATTLVPGERGNLHSLLLDPERGEQIWSEILKDGRIRTALRIVPTRTTDFAHLRDGWIRGITARTQSAAQKGSNEYNDEAFATSMNDFKALFGGARGKLPKAEVLYLLRNRGGELDAFNLKPPTAQKSGGGEQAADESKVEDVEQFKELGKVKDERISRLIWLGYLGGKTVSSEGARKSVVDGVMEFVGRPVGTVATQVI